MITSTALRLGTIIVYPLIRLILVQTRVQDPCKENQGARSNRGAEQIVNRKKRIIITIVLFWCVVLGVSGLWL